MNQKPFSPQTLADRWGCSPDKIRIMYRAGELAGFTLGKLIRIPAQEVERYECLSGDSQDTEASGRSPGTSQDENCRFESRLEQMTRGSRNSAPTDYGHGEPNQSRTG